MKKLIFIMMLMPGVSHAGFMTCHNGSGSVVRPSSSTAICVVYAIPPTSVVDYERIRNVVQTVPFQYLKWTVEPVEMTQAEKDIVDAAEAVKFDLDVRDQSKSGIDAFVPTPLLLRALVEVLIDEINILRQWMAEFKSEAAAATSLADFKARMATLPDTPDRNLGQAKSAIKNKIDTGGAIDEK